jgi:hypothetical protein
MPAEPNTHFPAAQRILLLIKIARCQFGDRRNMETGSIEQRYRCACSAVCAMGSHLAKAYGWWPRPWRFAKGLGPCGHNRFPGPGSYWHVPCGGLWNGRTSQHRPAPVLPLRFSTDKPVIRFLIHQPSGSIDRNSEQDVGKQSQGHRLAISPVSPRFFCVSESA